ncbi:hypothetical protein NPIL_630581, partial [Nephila pilipes]
MAMLVDRSTDKKTGEKSDRNQECGCATNVTEVITSKR